MLELVLRCGMDTLIASNIMCVPASTNMTNLTLGKAACVPGRLLGRPKTLAFSSLEIPLRKMKRLCLACLLEPIALSVCMEPAPFFRNSPMSGTSKQVPSITTIRNRFRNAPIVSPVAIGRTNW